MQGRDNIKMQVMQRAWQIFKSNHSFYSLDFCQCLIRSWEVEKANKKHLEEKEKTDKYNQWAKANKGWINTFIHENVSWKQTDKN